MMRLEMLVNGKWVGASGGGTFPVVNPATEETIAEVPRANREDARAAIEAARTAFDNGCWSALPGEERRRILLAVADGMKARFRELAETEARNAGATIRKTAGMDVPMAIAHLKAFAEGACLPMREALPQERIGAGSENYLVREPIGVCAGIIPWNFPLAMAVWKIGPALAMGNTIVLKPASATPLTALLLARIAAEAGLPPGVLNVVTGAGGALGGELAGSPLVDKVAFTGSTEIGREILRLAAPTIKKVTLELGGKSPNIILDDADLDDAVAGSLFATFLHQGQVCTSGTRLFVSRALHDRFVEKLVERARMIRIGDTLDEATTLGPVVSRDQYEKVLAYIEAGKREGAKLVLGGGRPAGFARGHFIEPTIFDEVENTMKIAREEIFGPVLSIIPYRDVDEAVRLANESIYGLAGAVWSRDEAHAVEVARRLRTGTVWVNDYHMLSAHAPFGGYKQSGLGREMGTLGLHEYTEVKHIHVSRVPPAKKKWYGILLP